MKALLRRNSASMLNAKLRVENIHVEGFLKESTAHGLLA